jgi:TolB protein
MRMVALATAASGILAAFAVPAQAAYPGANGRIAFAANGNWAEDYEIWTMDPDGSNRTRLTDNSVDDVAPSYSADGTKIVFQRQKDIYTMNADGTGVVRLTNTSAYESEPAFSPDGTKIAFAKVVGGDLEIMTMNADGTGVAQVTSNARDDLEPSYSPDGTRILYTHLANDGHFDIYRIKPDGTSSTRLTDCGGVTDCMQSDYSPNGQKITYTRWNWADEDNVFSEVFVASADGSGPVMKTAAGGYYNYSSFSPDGGYLVYAGGPQYELFRLNLSNGNVLRMTDTSADAYDAAWQPV